MFIRAAAEQTSDKDYIDGVMAQADGVGKLRARIEELEAEVERLREKLDTAVCQVCLQRLVREAESTPPSDDWQRDLAEM